MVIMHNETLSLHSAVTIASSASTFSFEQTFRRSVSVERPQLDAPDVKLLLRRQAAGAPERLARARPAARQVGVEREREARAAAEREAGRAGQLEEVIAGGCPGPRGAGGWCGGGGGGAGGASAAPPPPLASFSPPPRCFLLLPPPLSFSLSLSFSSFSFSFSSSSSSAHAGTSTAQRAACHLQSPRSGLSENTKLSPLPK